MAKALINKQKAKVFHKRYSRCSLCGRPHAVLKNTVFAEFALGNWHIKVRFGVKASW